MGLRLAEGIVPEEIRLRFGLDRLLDERAVSRLVDSGHLSWMGGRLRTTAAGRLLLDHILGQIADAQPPSAVIRSA
jgi:oxygen-independent coproporphyrinogen-3 oxidase